MPATRLVKIAAVYMLAGVVMGLVMGISGDFRLMSVHAHISLLGWATMAVAGIVYMMMPGCDRRQFDAGPVCDQRG